jgi:GWxTD domain-containing protein
MRKLLLFSLLVISAAALRAAEDRWLDQVAPIITPAERKIYLALPPHDRAHFEEDFFANKAITAEEYFSRLAYIDSTFGSGKLGSGANTDQGRVYLSLGPPTKVTRIPSSRIFVPLDIWYYDTVPELELNTELRLIFYQKNSIGFPRLYSPTLDTLRALLLPTASTIGMFGPNDTITESSIRGTLNVSPAEDEVVTASVNVATGIKYSGNDEILGRVMSPDLLLGKQRTDVKSRLILSHPRLDVVQTPSVYGGAQVDLRLEIAVAHELDVEVLDGQTPVYENHLHLKFPKPEAVHYTHRLDLLPGSYRLVFTADNRTWPNSLEVPQQASMGEILRADANAATSDRHTPFEFDGRQLELNPDGKFAFVALPKAGKLTWIIRRGAEAVSRNVTEANGIAVFDIASAKLAPGTYRIEAVTDDDSRTAPLIVKSDSDPSVAGTSLSFNANLAPALRYAFVGHQWLLRGKLDEARRSLQASIGKGVTLDAEVELARADALGGQFDAARDRLRKVLAVQADNFEALAVYGFVEAQFQDFPVAAQLYRRALAIQDSPALRIALAKLPAQ